MTRADASFGIVTLAPEFTRRANLSHLLSLLHQHGPHSRAELTRATGLNRSTVANLIARLCELGFVYESAAETHTGVGRPSPLVRIADGVRALAISPEVDAVTIGLIALDGRVVAKARYATDHPPTPSEVVNITTAVLEGMRNEIDESQLIAGVGVAVPGLTRSDDGLVVYAPRLDWRDVPIAAMLSEATGYEVSAANDASLGAGAELLFGAGRGVADLLYLNGGASGVGGGIVSRGRLRGGRSGFAGELGHTLVTSGGAPCHCGARGCLEAEVSLENLQDLVGLRGADIATVEEALEREWSKEIESEVKRQVTVLSIALRNAVNAFNPARIILGGFLGTLYRLDAARMEELTTRSALSGPGADVRITGAQLGSDLLIGAAQLAFAPLLDDPELLASR